MTKYGTYYSMASIYQLELNLHKIRQELTLMMEEFEKQECLICFRLKCLCHVKATEKDGVTLLAQADTANDPSSKSPPDYLMPKFEITNSFKEGNKDINYWIPSAKSGESKRIPNDVLLTSFMKSWAESQNVKRDRSCLNDMKKTKMFQFKECLFEKLRY